MLDKSKLIELLHRVNKTITTITSAAKYIVENKYDYREVIRIWRDQFFDANDNLQRLYYLFVVNEVFVLTDDRNIVREFEYVLPECFELMDPDNSKVQALINRWREKQIFDQSFIEKLERRISSDSRRDYDKRHTRLESPYSGSLRKIFELTEDLNLSVLNEEARKRDVESINPDILSGLIATKVRTDEQRANAFKMLDEASQYLKEYEDVLYDNSKKRKDLEYRLNELLLDHRRLINETQRTIEDVQSKRKVIDQVRISLAGGREVRSQSRDRYSYSDQHKRDSYRNERSRSDRNSPYDDRDSRKSSYGRRNDRYDRQDRIIERKDERRVYDVDRYGGPRQNRNSFRRSQSGDRRSESNRYNDSGRKSFNDKKRYRDDNRRHQDIEPSRTQPEGNASRDHHDSRHRSNTKDDFVRWDVENNTGDWGSEPKRAKTNDDDWGAETNTGDDWGSEPNVKANDDWGSEPNQEKKNDEKQSESNKVIDDWGAVETNTGDDWGSEPNVKTNGDDDGWS